MRETALSHHCSGLAGLHGPATERGRIDLVGGRFGYAVDLGTRRRRRRGDQPMRIAALLSVLLFAACGADGPPEKQTPEPPTGLSVSGDARIGVVGSF